MSVGSSPTSVIEEEGRDQKSEVSKQQHNLETSLTSDLWLLISSSPTPWSRGEDSWPTPRQRWFESIRGYLRSAGVVAARLRGKEEDRVQFPSGPLMRIGLLVQWDDAGSARRKSGFNSPAVHSMGCWSNGKTPGLHPGNRGSTPRRSTL